MLEQNCCRVLTPQEERIYEESIGNTEKYRKGRERIYKIIDSFDQKRPVMDAERAIYFTESMIETEGEHLTLRWAKALMNVAKKITIYIDQDSLLVGRAGPQGRYGILYPEIDGHFLKSSLKRMSEKNESPFDMIPEQIPIILEKVAPYWENKSFWSKFIPELPPETRRLLYDPATGNQFARNIVNDGVCHRTSLQWVPDYKYILDVGWKGVKEEAEMRLAALDPDSPTDYTQKKPFLEAMVLISDAIVLWAHRHGDKARELAKEEKDPKRKQELVEIADRCYWVPENPPRDFKEALQAQWFTQMFSRIEQKTGTIVSNGRMDQYFYPYYKADINAGRLTDREALEWFECMWVGMAQFIDLNINETGSAYQQGYAHWEALTIGGQTSDGRDATNELSYMFLKSKRELPLHYPDLAARIHAGSPERFVRECAITIKDGSGYPKLLNDEEIIPILLAKGAPMEDAYDYAVSGCSEARMPNRDTMTSGCAFVNYPLALEMVFNNGRTKKTGDELIGIETGDVLGYSTWKDFYGAFAKQVKYLLKHAIIQQAIANNLRGEHFGSPLHSAMHKLCRENCLDLHKPFIPGGINLGYIELLGYGTIVDSLVAVKKLVFEDEVITMSQLKEALDCNFEGKEVLRQLLVNAPKYGNNDPYVDSLAKDVSKMSLDYVRKYAKEIGCFLDMRMVPATAHVAFGRVVGATPNGRVAGYPLSDAASPSQGADVNGPTAVLLSTAHSKNFGYRERAARLLNIKLTPACVAGEEGTQKLVNFIRTWCDLKLWHMQFNIVNKETLLSAQKEPEKYKSLIVRIAGYSAYFVDLSEDLQEDLIARTEHEAV